MANPIPPDFNADFNSDFNNQPQVRQYKVIDIVNLALYDAGIVGLGQVANAQDANLAFTRLNFMLDEWALQRWLIWHTVDLSIVSTGALSYTIGPGGDVYYPYAPDRLEAAFFRQLVLSQPNQIDYPVRLLQGREDYNNISLKNLVSFPECVFYDPGVSLGTFYFWPVPQAYLYEMHMTVKAVLNEFTGLNQTISLPREYYKAILNNLTVILRDAYDLPPKPVLIGMAKKSLAVIRGANAQVSKLDIPEDLARPGIYNPYSDQIR
jgi:hypothetical protein